VLPFPRPSKIVCVGRNYLAHARELGNELPSEPLIFLKPPSSLLSEGEAIVLPPGVGRVDFEGEIGLLVGTRLKNASPSEAGAAVSAVLPLNDVTARDLQRSDPQWTRAKGFDTFCPVGPVRPLAEIDLDALTVTTRLNGEVRQESPADDMVFGIPALVAHISGVMTLEPGDLIATGTPSGVGPLSPGDVIEVEIGGVGSVSNPVVAAG
jgi:2-keto-4-pentenoate hydratase/2-oxohepta-3-ene-1,7-dioic acid hydratase in catechol pathway